MISNYTKLIPALAFLAFPALASEGGYSNYIPGFYGDLALATEPATEFSIRNDVYYYSADDDLSALSGRLAVNADISFAFNYATFVHKPGIELFGAQYAYGLTVVYGNIDIDIDLLGTGFNVKDDKTALGDITLTPALLFWNKDNFHFMLAQYVVVPTADYDSDDVANTGLNYWTFETDIAATYLNETTGQDYSAVFGYGYNTENDATDYQSGQELHLDYVFNQFLNENWAVGIHGFYFKQVTADKGRGALLGDFKAEAAGIGPAIMWAPSRFNGEVAFVAKWLHEYHAEHRLQGDHVFLSFMMSL